MAGKANHRGFGHLRRLPSKRWQASYQGPDLARYTAPRTFVTKGHAEAWLAAERGLISGVSGRRPPSAAKATRGQFVLNNTQRGGS